MLAFLLELDLRLFYIGNAQGIHIDAEYTYFSMLITDRWGNTVFASNNVNAKWDGKYKGNLCAEDIYIYKIESTEKSTEKHVTRSGHIALFR